MNNAITTILRKAIAEKVFPGAVVGVIKNGERQIIHAGHYTYEKNSPEVNFDTIYDLASVTKSVATAAVLLKLVDLGVISLEDSVSTFLPEFDEDPFKKEVTVWHLLTYTIELDLPSLKTYLDLSPDEIISKVLNARLLSIGKKYCYTNPTAILAGLLAEKLTGKTLEALAEEYFYLPLGMSSTSFHPKDISHVAPTELESKTGKLLQGVVHDESTRALSKKYVTGAAGLFGNVPDLLTFADMLLSRGRYKDVAYFTSGIIEEMAKNQIADMSEDAGLGWEQRREWMGKNLSERHFGKSGFTGTSIIVDLEKEIALVILSNRVHPKRPADPSAINNVRRAIADVVFGDN